MALITKDQVLSARQPRFEDVPVPELAEGGEARICTMTGVEREEWETSIYTLNEDGKTVRVNQNNWRANLVANCWKDENFERMFRSGEEVLSLGNLDGKVLARLAKVAARLNGIGKEEEEALGKN